MTGSDRIVMVRAHTALIKCRLTLFNFIGFEEEQI